jgi:transcriptional regulator with XRE-family HTH domain
LLGEKLKYLMKTRLRPVDNEAERLRLEGVDPGDVPMREHRPKEIAEAIGCAPAYVTQICSGKRSNLTVNYLNAMAKLFGCTVDYLVDDEIPIEINESAPITGLADTGLGLADRINVLFAKFRPDGGAEYSTEYVAEQIGTTPGNLLDLRSGANKDPNLTHLLGLAHFFNVDVAYLIGSAQLEANQGPTGSEILRKLDEAGLMGAAARLADMNTATANAFMAFLEAMNKAERDDDNEASPLANHARRPTVA